MAADWDVDVWPDCVLPVEVFSAMSTQWRFSGGGVSGLDYNVLPMLFDMYKVQPDERTHVMNDIRLMEHHAIAEIRK